MNSEYRTRYRSLFWPVVLIGVGVIWLMSNLGYINPANLNEAWRFWPVVLIAVGLDILAGRRFPIIGALLGLVIVALIGFLLIQGFQLPGARSPEVVTEHLTLPVENARQANVSLNFWSDPVKLYVLEDSSDLIDANITHSGQINFQGSGSDVKTVSLSHHSNLNAPFFMFDSINQRADIGLTPDIPLDLTIDGGSGSLDLDMSQLTLAGLNIDSGSGSVEMSLAKSTESYPVDLNSGSGSIRMTIPEGTNANVVLDTGSGSVNIRVAQGTALHIDIQDSGSGSTSLPSGLTQTRSGKDDEGTWETPGYSSAQNKVSIVVKNLGSGSLHVSN